MAGETGEVSSIGVKLTLEAGEFMGGMKAAQGSLNTFQQQAAKAGSGAAQLKAGGGKQAASGPSSAQNLAGVNVSLALSDAQLTQLRKRIQGALQNIPITVTTAGSKSARAEAQSVVAAVSTPAIGTRTGAAHAVDRAVRQNLPQKAHGGPVQAGRAVIVGEHRPEVFIPRSHGRIEPDATRFYRDQERFRRREAELAALEYTQQRRHEREMGRFAGGPVEGPLARRLREGAYRPTPPPPVEQPQPIFEPEWMRRAREQRLPPKVFRMAGGPVRTFTVADPMGLHMRPSSVLAQVAQHYPDASIQIRNLTNGASSNLSPRSMMGWAQLMAIPGDEIQMIGNEGSELALHQLARLGGSPKLTGLARRRLKRRWSENWAASHAWRGVRHAGAGAIALRATLANEGGTFPLYGGPQPPKGYAVGIETGTSQLADPNDPRDFFRKYNAQRKAQMAAGDFPPFVGTWLHEGQIHIDPAAVLGRRREADLVARAKSQLAFFDLKRFDEIPTSTHKLRATAERVNQLIMSGRKRQEGGPAYAFRSSGKPSELMHRASGGVAVAGQPHGLVHPSGGFMSQIFQTAADWANDPFMAIMSYQSMQAQKRQTGGPVRKLFTVADELGLHMRPSAHLARMASDYDAFVTIQNMTRAMPEQGVAQAKYMHHWLAIAARQGNQIMIEASGKDALNAVRGIGGMIENPGLTRIASANRSLEREDPARLRAAEIFSKFTGRAGGGKAGGGLYIVGEIGPELFVPSRLAGMIPKKVMDQIPRAASGGIIEIGRKRNELFAPPEDGIIIPNRLMDQIPHAAPGFNFMGNPVPGNQPMGFDRGETPAQTTAGIEHLFSAINSINVPNATINAPQATVAATGATQAAGGRLLGPNGQPIAQQAAAATGEAPPGFMRMGRLQFPESQRGLIEKMGQSLTPEEIFHAMKSQGSPGVSLMEDPAAAQNIQKAREFSAQMGSMTATMSSWQQTMSGRTPRGLIAQLSSVGLGGRKEMFGLQFQARAQARELVATVGTDTDVKAKMTEYAELHEKLAGSRGKEAEAIKGQIGAIEKGGGLDKEQAERLAKATTQWKGLAETMQKLAPTTAGMVRNLGTIIGATTLYGVVMQGASKAMSMGIDVVQKQADAFMGWQPMATRVTTTMADQTLAAGGNVRAAMAQAAATAGLSGAAYDWVKDALSTTVLIKAGAKAMGETQDLMRASMGAVGAPSGLYGGTGGVLGTSFLASYMGGTKGFSENVQGLLSGNRMGAGGVDLVGNFQKGLDFMTNPDVRDVVLGEAKKQGNVLGAMGDALGLAGKGLRGASSSFLGPFALGPFAPFGMIAGAVGETAPTNPMETGTYNPKIGLDDRGIAANAAVLEDLNVAAAKGAQQLKSSVDVTWRYAKSLEEEDAAYRMAMASGDMFGATMARTSHVIMAVNEEVAKSAEDYKKAMTETAVGKTMVSASVWADMSYRQLQAQRQAAGMQQQRQIEYQIPTQMWKSLLQQPLIAPGAAFFPGGAAGTPSASAAGLTGEAAKIAQAALGSAAESQAKLRGIAGAGQAQARENIYKFNPTSLPAFDAAAYEAQGLSDSIVKLTTDMARANQEASQASWNNQIRLANRSFGDAVGMLGKSKITMNGIVGVATRLGQLQREQWMTSRASQQLGLQLQQRQITTQLALAQFQAPGETGEERYFRQKERIAEAGIAQTQLGFSWKEFTISGDIWKENVQRMAEDASRAVDIAQKSRNAEGITIANQEAVAEAQKLLGVTLGNIDAMLGTADTNWGNALSAATQGISQFAGSLEDGMKAVYSALGYSSTKNPKTGALTFRDTSGLPGGGPLGDTFTRNGLPVGWEQFFGPGMSPTPQPEKRPVGSSSGPQKNAAGYFGVANRATSMIVGEAGPETIAVIRNARSVTMGGGVADVKLVESSIASWVKAFTVAFPKVLLADKSVKDIKDAFAVAVKDIAGTPATGDAKKKSAGDGSQIKSYDTSMPKNERLDRFATALSKKTGLSFEASRKWAQAEVGGYNNLGIMTTNAQGKRVPMQYATPELGATAAAGLINSSSNYAGIRASTKGSTLQQLIAIANSPWHEGFKPGIDPYYARIFGLKAQGDLGHTMGATPMIVGEAGRETVAILRNPRSASMSGMGGGGPVTVNINGPVVRNDQDISSLARQVAIEVERSLSRKGQMFGLRGPAV